ncbi:hypothetical protein ACLK14_16700 [Escherichia coli]
MHKLNDNRHYAPALVLKFLYTDTRWVYPQRRNLMTIPVIWDSEGNEIPKALPSS